MKRNRRSIVLKSPREIEIMREASRHTAEILDMMCRATEPGVSTWDLDQIARAEIKRRKITSAFLGYHGYPATICASVNEEIVHGIPNKQKVLKDGDIIGIDFGTICGGYVGDTARTVIVGEGTTEEAATLVEQTKRSLEEAILQCRPGNRLSDIGKTVQSVADERGYGVVREFVGHGIGTRMHEDPQVPNYYDGPKPRLKVGLVIAVEPMFNLGTHEVQMLDDGWTALTRDRKWSAHFEHTIAITEDGPDVLTRL